MKFQFNTGRLYARDGQRIDVEATTDGTLYTVKFWDRSRMIDGGFTMPDRGHHGEQYMRAQVLERYDYMQYTQLWFFEFIRRQERMTPEFQEMLADSERRLNAPSKNASSQDSGSDAMARATALEVVRRARQLAQAQGIDWDSAVESWRKGVQS